jgi:hypothetical protein
VRSERVDRLKSSESATSSMHERKTMMNRTEVRPTVRVNVNPDTGEVLQVFAAQSAKRTVLRVVTEMHRDLVAAQDRIATLEANVRMLMAERDDRPPTTLREGFPRRLA